MTVVKHRVRDLVDLAEPHQTRAVRLSLALVLEPVTFKFVVVQATHCSVLFVQPRGYLFLSVVQRLSTNLWSNTKFYLVSFSHLAKST